MEYLMYYIKWVSVLFSDTLMHMFPGLMIDNRFTRALR